MPCCYAEQQAIKRASHGWTHNSLDRAITWVMPSRRFADPNEELQPIVSEVTCQYQRQHAYLPVEEVVACWAC